MNEYQTEYLVSSIVRAISEYYSDGKESSSVYGINIETNVFQMHRFCWCEKQDCPYCWNESEHGPRKSNFHYKPTDFRVNWYKYIGRSMEINRQVSIKECSKILYDCLDD